MKRRIVCFLSAILAISAVTLKTDAHAGTIMVGAKAWYVEWDSAYDKANADYLYNNSGYTSTVEPGTGFLAGPLLGYQTDDNQWSFSAAFMLFSSFTNDTVWSNVGVKTETELNRKDIDVSASYMLVDFMKVFVGFKYTKAVYDLNLEDGTDWYEAELINKVPTAGVAFGTSITEGLVIGIQFGAMYVIPKLTEKYTNGTSLDIKMDNSYGVTIEPNLTYMFTENFMIQLGARYQIYSVKFTDPDWNSTKNDQMLGGTLAVVYLW